MQIQCSWNVAKIHIQDVDNVQRCIFFIGENCIGKKIRARKHISSNTLHSACIGPLSDPREFFISIFSKFKY